MLRCLENWIFLPSVCSSCHRAPSIASCARQPFFSRLKSPLKGRAKERRDGGGGGGEGNPHSAKNHSLRKEGGRERRQGRKEESAGRRAAHFRDASISLYCRTRKQKLICWLALLGFPEPRMTEFRTPRRAHYVERRL